MRPLWALDGSFLVFRKLKQLVPEFNKFLTDNHLQNAAGTLTVQQGADLLGARMVGRWKSGAPIDLSPTADDPVSTLFLALCRTIVSHAPGDRLSAQTPS